MRGGYFRRRSKQGGAFRTSGRQLHRFCDFYNGSGRSGHQLERGGGTSLWIFSAGNADVLSGPDIHAGGSGGRGTGEGEGGRARRWSRDGRTLASAQGGLPL